MKKFSGWILLVFLIISSLASAGCMPAALRSGSPAPAKESTPKTSLAPVRLKLWHIWATDSDSNKRPFEKALADWNLKNPNIQIETEATENETYKIKLRTAIAVNEAPDIFYCWGAGFAKPFIDAGKVLALDEYLDESVKDKLVPGSLDNFTYNGKIYALPTFLIAGIFYCNKELFDKYGARIPETYDELLTAVSIFKKNGLTPISIGQKDGWPGMFYQNILAIRIAGIEQTIAALRKEASFNQYAFIESARKLTELVKAGAFDSRCMQLTQHEAELAFINGLTPMYYGGSWAAGSIDREDSPVRGKIVVRNFPAIESASGDDNGFVGGAIDTFMVSSSTRHKSEAVSAMISLDENFCQESYLSGAGIPAWKVDVDQSKITPLELDIIKLLENRDGFVLAWDTFLSGDEAQIHINLITELFAGRLTPEDFGREMQKINSAN